MTVLLQIMYRQIVDERELQQMSANYEQTHYTPLNIIFRLS